MEKQLYLYDSKIGWGNFVSNADFSTFENLILNSYNDTSPKELIPEMNLIPDLIPDMSQEGIPANKKLARFLDLRNQGFLYCRTQEEAELAQAQGHSTILDLLVGDIVLVYSPFKYSHETLAGYYVGIITDIEEDGCHSVIIIDGLDAKYLGLDSNCVCLDFADKVYIIKEAFEIPSCRNL